MTSPELLLVLLLLAMSAFMSGSEIALFSLSRFQMRALKERALPAHRKIKRLLADPGGLLITILVVNEIVNISLSTVFSNLVERYTPGPVLGIPEWAVNTFLGTLVTIPIVLFLGEITPKVVASRLNQLVAALNITPLSLIYDLFRPIRTLLTRTVEYTARTLGGDRTPPSPEPHDSASQPLKESDFLMMVEEGHREGAIRQTELELIKNVFELDDTPVCDICTPLSRLRSIPVHTTLRAALGAIRGMNFSRVPVVSPDRKFVVGILYTKDLLKAKLDPSMMDLPVEAVMKKPLTVSPTQRLNAVFRRFKQQKTHMAIVQEGNGPAVGIITMNDIFSALFEDLLTLPDEEDAAEPAPRGKP